MGISQQSHLSRPPPIMIFTNQDRQGFVTLSEAKGLSRWAQRCFAALSMTVSVLIVKIHYRPNERGESIARDQCADIETLYRRYYPGVLTFLCFLVGTPEVAEDLTSLVFEKALMHLADLRTPGTAGPWLFRIARNCAADYFRRCKPTVSLDHLVPAEHPQIASLEERAIAGEEQGVLLAQLVRLSEREREVIGLKFVANLNNREIAHVLQIPEGTVGSLLYRALRRLRAALSEEGGLDEG